MTYSDALMPGEGMRPDPFFDMLAQQAMGLTYDDVLLLTQPDIGTESPSVPDLSSMFSRNVPLRVPFVSSPMDTVTESPMAIAMAELGGLGIVHHVMSIEDQRREVRRVKHHVNGRIDHPVSFGQERTVGSILRECDDKGYRFRTFPITGDELRLMGVVTQAELDFAETEETTIGDLMIAKEELRTADAETTLEAAYEIMQRERVTTLPLLDQDGRIAGMYLYGDVKRIHRDHSTYNTDRFGRLLVGAAVSTGNDAVERAAALADYTDVLVIDSANGDSFFARQAFEKIKETIPQRVDVVWGNITSPRSSLIFAKMGADGIRGGQGPGSICSTRRETGIGRAQLTAIHWMSRTLRENGYSDVPVCADGGIRYHGDPPKALAIGASSVMLGSGVAGADESPGKVVVDQKTGERKKIYRGMGSRDALLDNEGSRDRYQTQGAGVLLPQGESGTVPYKGPLSIVLGEYVAGLVACVGYTKNSSLARLRATALLERISPAGLAESHPHSIQIT